MPKLFLDLPKRPDDCARFFANYNRDYTANYNRDNTANYIRDYTVSIDQKLWVEGSLIASKSVINELLKSNLPIAENQIYRIKADILWVFWLF